MGMKWKKKLGRPKLGALKIREASTRPVFSQLQYVWQTVDAILANPCYARYEVESGKDFFSASPNLINSACLVRHVHLGGLREGTQK